MQKDFRRFARALAATRSLSLFARACIGVGVFGALSACGGGGDPTGPGAVTKIEVSTTSVVLNTLGGTQQVTATARDAKSVAVPTAVISWSSDNTSIATVTGSGSTATITSVGAGATVVHARAAAVSADVAVQVLGVRGLQVNPSAVSIRSGDSQTLTATFDADPGVSQAVTWTSASSAIATVSAGGVVTGVSAGATTVRATSVVDPRISNVATVSVSPGRSVTVTPNTGSVGTGQTIPLAATVQIEAGLSTAVTWRSSSTAIATVSQTGVVTGVALGTVTITALSQIDSLARGTATISVVPIVRTVTVSPTTASVFINSTQQLTPTVTADGTVSTAVTWRALNPNIATVSAAGLVTGVALGTTTITVLSNIDTTKRATATITVAPKTIAVAIVQRVVGLNPGGSTTLTATVTADPNVSTAVTWSSATPTVATISQAGTVSAIASGTTIITAISQADNTKRDTVTVSVIPRLATTWSASRLNATLFDDVLSIAPFSDGTAFAVNSVNGGASGGDVYRFNGTTWTRTAIGTQFNTRFLAVHGQIPTQVIAVGTNGVIARFDGTTWTTMASGTTRTLRSVWVENASSIYAVGDNGTVLRYNGTAWSAITSNSTQQLNSVWASAGVAYVVGNNADVLRITGTTSVRQSVPYADDLNGVTGVGGGIITAVGRVGGILQFNGQNWTLINSNGVGDDFYSVAAVANNRAYIGGSSGVYVLDVATLVSTPITYRVATFGVAVDASNDVWAAGQRGAVQRFSGGAWTTNNFAPDLLDVWTTSATNSWAVGEYGFVFRWNGTSWTRQTTPSAAHLYTVWGASATDAFAGGDNGTMLRWNGTAWTAQTFPSTARVFAVWGSSSSNVFAVTDIGEILRFNGTTWSLQTTAASNATLLSVYGVSATEVYASGVGGLVMRYNGTTWSTMTSPNSATTLFGVWMTGSNNLLSVGSDADGAVGFAFGYNGTSWTSSPIGATKALTSVWGTGVSDVYATGDGGTLLRFNGTTWQSTVTGTTDLLWALSGAPDASGGAFAVGYNSTIVTGSASGGVQASIRSTFTSPDALALSSAAQHDRKASGAAAAGAARRSKAALARTRATRQR